MARGKRLFWCDGRVIETLARIRGVRFVRLPVSAAFHSRFVADAAMPFRNALDGIDIHPATAPRIRIRRPPRKPPDPTALRDWLGMNSPGPAYTPEFRPRPACGRFSKRPRGETCTTAEILASDPVTAATVACVSVECKARGTLA